MPFEIVRNDITNMQVDAIVNAASRYPRVNAGVDGAIHQKAGAQLLKAREEIGYIPPGTAAVTPGFRLDAKFVIHAATPIWETGENREPELLRQAYDMCLDLALEKGCQSIAFPLLATGNHGFPKDKALQIALSAFSEFLLRSDMQIYLVVFGKDSYQLSRKLVDNITSYIDQHYVDAYEKATGMQRRRAPYQGMSRNMPEDEMAAMPMPSAQKSACAPAPKKSFSLKEFLKKKDAGFTQTLLELIQKRGCKNSAVYKKANISKQHFSKLINDPEAKPSKATAVALALALELDVAQTNDLIGRAGFTLSNSSKFDVIIRYFIEQRNFNIVEINLALYEFDQTLLGA